MPSTSPAKSERKEFKPASGWRRPISFVRVQPLKFLAWVLLVFLVGGVTLWRDLLTDWPTALAAHIPASFCYVLLASALAEGVVLAQRKPQYLKSEDGRNVAAMIVLFLLLFQATVVDSKIEKNIATAGLARASSETKTNLIVSASANIPTPPSTRSLSAAGTMTGALFGLQLFVLVVGMAMAMYLRTFQLEALTTPVDDDDFKEDTDVKELSQESGSKKVTAFSEEL